MRIQSVRQTCLCLLLILFCTISPLQAAGTTTTQVDFAVTGKSIWSSADSAQANVDKFYGLEWNEGWSLDYISRNVQDPILGLNLGDYGAAVGFDTSGKIGAQITAQYDSGTLDINSPMSVQVTSATTGGNANHNQISTAYSLLPGTKFTTSAMEGRQSVDLIFDVDAVVWGNACFINCTGRKSIDLFPFDELLPSIPPLVDVTSHQQDSGNTFGGALEWTAKIPSVSTQGSLPASALLSGNVASDQRTMTSSGTDFAFRVGLDVDQVIASFTGIPMGFDQYIGSKDWNVGVGVSGDLLDVNLNANANLKQTFEVELFPKISLEFSRPVWLNDEFGWVPVSGVTTSLGQGVEVSTSGLPVTVTPTYSLDLRVKNQTAVNLESTLNVVVGRLGYELDYYFDSTSGEIGPLYDSGQIGLGLFDFDIPIYTKSWRLHGDDVAGEAFFLDYTMTPLEFSSKSEFDGVRSEEKIAVTLQARDNFTSLLGNYTEQSNGGVTFDKSDLLTENPQLIDFFRDYSDADTTRIDYWTAEARGEFCGLLESFGMNCRDVTPFLDDFENDIGADLQPLFTDDVLTGLSLSFFDLDREENNFADLTWDDLLDTSLVFLFDPIVGETDVSIYGRRTDNLDLFDFHYTTMEQRGGIFLDRSEPVPEPSTLLLTGLGLLGLFVVRRRRQ